MMGEGREREAGRGSGYWGREGIQCINSSLTNPSGICLTGGFVKVALSCSEGVQPVASVPATFVTVQLLNSASA